MSESIVLYRCHGNSIASTALGMDYQCRDCGGTMKEDGVWYRDSEIARLSKERDELLTFARDLERHCLNKAGLRGLRHTEEGQELRARLQCIIAKADKETGR